MIAGSVDDRTEEERGLKVRDTLQCSSTAADDLVQPLKNDRFVIPKSRYDSVDLYISNDWNNRPEYNDNPLPYDEAIYARLQESGMCIDPLLAS